MVKSASSSMSHHLLSGHAYVRTSVTGDAAFQIVDWQVCTCTYGCSPVILKLLRGLVSVGEILAGSDTSVK